MALDKDFDILPFANVGNNVFYQKEFSVGQMLPQVPLNGEVIAKAPIEPIEQTLDNDNSEITNNEEGKSEMINSDNVVNDLFEHFFGESTIMERSDRGDPDIPDSIEPTIKILEGKGYQVKYSSPGWGNTKFKNDKDNDNVVNGKFVSTARIIFSRNYDFPNTPDHWEWRGLDNGAKALYAKPITYQKEKGTESEEFQNWKKKYLGTLHTWAKNLPEAGKEKKESKPDENFE